LHIKFTRESYKILKKFPKVHPGDFALDHLSWLQ